MSTSYIPSDSVTVQLTGRRRVLVSGVGLVFTETGRWWRRSGEAGSRLLEWDEVRAVRLRRVPGFGPNDMSGNPFTRSVLEIDLYREQDGLPRYATPIRPDDRADGAEEARGPGESTGRAAAGTIRLFGVAGVRKLSRAIERARPGLVRAGPPFTVSGLRMGTEAIASTAIAAAVFALTIVGFIASYSMPQPWAGLLDLVLVAPCLMAGLYLLAMVVMLGMMAVRAIRGERRT